MGHYVIESQKTKSLVEDFHTPTLTDARVYVALNYKHRGMIHKQANGVLVFITDYDTYKVKKLG